MKSRIDLQNDLLVNGELNKEYVGVDVTKFICSYLICIIHIIPFVGGTVLSDNLNYYIRNGICRVAVPFFFAATAFLLFQKQESNSSLENDRIKKTCFKLFRLWGTWEFLSVLGGNHQMWYLGASALTIILINVLFKCLHNLKWIGLCCIILYSIGLIGDSYRGLISPVIDNLPFKMPSTRNAVFMGLMFAFIGIVITRIKLKINLKWAALGLFISILLLYVELFFLKNYSRPFDFNMYISLVPLTFFLLYIAVSIKMKDRKNLNFFRKLRVYSVLIYFTHLIFSELFDFILSRMKTGLGIDITSFKLIIVLVVVTIVAIIIEDLSHRRKLCWIKYLYS